MEPGRAAQLFARRMLLLEPAKVCPIPGLRNALYRVVAAGAVVTRDVPAATLVAGVPARPVKTLPV